MGGCKLKHDSHDQFQKPYLLRTLCDIQRKGDGSLANITIAEVIKISHVLEIRKIAFLAHWT